MSNSPVRTLVFAPGLLPSVVIGVLKPLVALENLGEVAVRLRFSSVRLFADNDLEWCEVAVFCRNCEIADLEYLYQLKRLGKRVIYEVDDNFEEISLNTPIGIYHRSFYRLHALRRFFALADLTRVYSERMRLRGEAHGAKVRVVRSYFDANLIQGIPAPAKGGVIKIAYPTGRIDDPRLEAMFYEALRQVLLTFQGRIELHLWRKSCPSQLTGVPGVVLNPGVRSYEAFVKSFYAQGFDIGLAPLVDEPFFHSKSNNKYREFGGCAVAAIYSDMPPYADCVVHEETGLLVENTVEAWVQAIGRLIGDRELRNVIARNARSDVERNFNFQNAVASFRQILSEVQSASPRRSEWLYQKDSRLIVAFVDSVAEGKDQTGLPKRLDIFYNTIGLLKGDYYLNSAYELLTNPVAATKSNVVLLVVDVLTDLEQGKLSFPLCNSVILDLSQLRCEPDVFLSTFAELNIAIPMSWLLADGQEGLAAYARRIGMSYAVASPSATRIENDYSLRGYSAAYLDLIERHTCHGKVLKQAKLRGIGSAIGARLQRLADLIAGYSGRVNRVWLLFLWRLGKRRL
jgi:glycosyltransferase involved in cell wall biosynthesis